MPAQMLIRNNPDTKNKFIKLSRIEGSINKYRKIKIVTPDEFLRAYYGPK